MNKNMSQLDAALLKQMDAYWRAANYLSVGQIYLLDNPLLKQPLKLRHLSDDDPMTTCSGRHHRSGSTDCRITRQK